MHRVRYYSNLYEPMTFTGWRGRWIRLLNRLRFWLELKVCYQVFQDTAAKAGLKGKAYKDALWRFKKDAQEETYLLTRPVQVEPPKPPLISFSAIDSVETSVNNLANMSHEKGYGSLAPRQYAKTTYKATGTAEEFQDTAAEMPNVEVKYHGGRKQSERSARDVEYHNPDDGSIPPEHRRPVSKAESEARPSGSEA